MRNTLDDLFNAPGTPNYLIDRLVSLLGAKNDADLCRIMSVPPPVISKIRKERVGVTPAFLLVAHEVTGVDTQQLRAWMGDTDEIYNAYPAYKSVGQKQLRRPKGWEDRGETALRSER